MENPFAQKLAALNRPNYGKLTFEEQCGYYACLMLDVPPAAVAVAAGISQATTSLLGGAGEVRGGQLRYPKVGRELATLGREAFVHKYLTPIIRERIDQAIDAYRRSKRNPDINERGFNPRANRYCGRHDWPKTSIGLPAHFFIDLLHERGGYFWFNLKPQNHYPEIPLNMAKPQGNPERERDANGHEQGFATSEDCYRWVQNYLNPKE